MYNLSVKEDVIENYQEQTERLVKEITEWPLERVRSLCLDQSDVELVQTILYGAH